VTFSIIGCGDSGKEWDGSGISIGVNDAAKFGHPLTYLLVCNRPQQFSSERLETIINTRPKYFYSHKSNWAEWFPEWKKLRLETWGTHRYHLVKGHYYASDTSPFIAMTLAYNLGATKIIIYGVDFKHHHIFHELNPQTNREVERYKQLVEALREQGVEVYLGAKGSALESFLTVYKKELV